MADAPARRKVTIPMLMTKMKKGEPITQLAAYDYRTAVVSDRLGMDILCVSDTGGMILFGHKSTVTVSFDEVMMMAKAIDRGSKYGLRMVDMPYWSFHVSKEEAVENAGRFVHEANAEVMKCEGNKYHAPNIEAIVRAGVPVQGHIGITPMRMPQLGGFVAQGKTAKRAKEMVEDAKAFVDAGCFSILCEVTTSEVAEYLAQTLPVPVISLGAGNCAHGVHIISSDLFHHGGRDFSLHEGRRQPRVSGGKGNRLYGARRSVGVCPRDEVGTQDRRTAFCEEEIRVTLCAVTRTPLLLEDTGER
jgi:3-methyl-2-oxobutanoate hydroxymethyltransferase